VKESAKGRNLPKKGSPARKAARRRASEAKPKAPGVTSRRQIRRLPFPSEHGDILQAISKRRYRGLVGLATRKLADDPWNGDLHAALVVGCGHYGDFACVEGSHDEALATDSLVLMREEAKADALRYLGRPLDAAELRRELVVDDARASREQALLSKLVYDYEAAGDLEQAWDVAWEAVALNPEGSVGWALVARVASASGQMDEAESYLWLADRAGSDSVLRTASRADISRAGGDPLDASTMFNDKVVSRVQSMQYAVARSRALLEADLVGEVLDMHRDCSWCLGEVVWHPELMGTFGEALARDGQVDQATHYADRLQHTYPDYPPAIAAVAAIRSHLHAAD